MIYTVTFNPAIDYVVHTDGMKLGDVNRSSHEEIYFGGKGINVSVVLAELGVASKTLGFTAGFTGKAIEQGVCSMGIEADFVRLERGNSRINVKIKSDEETELNGQDPDISTEALEKLFAKLDKLVDGDTLILAGSIPGTLPSDIYEKILERLSDRSIKTVVDATGDLLMNVLKYRPYLVKPNDRELEEIFGVTLTTQEQVAEYAEKLRSMGARNVLVSMAEKGAVLLDENGVLHKCGVCSGKVRNSVGAGDSMVAGFVAGMMNGDFDHAMKLGTACGGATTFSDGLAKRSLIDELMKQL
ncbi:1-phosphofructokinase [Ruminococcus sp.]|uniref:1-phosphofructokinase n=1 Tax=Ruminococcus sp. TaxID=41978 RepID=UPI002CA18B72|nr:1-phosphofructokinase [Ruminococcus sp.]HNZ98494.1 1-phosphofructokinase [Ruminococcus sp.]HOH87311.1 1-phosphofructokinase [Ruminococcus sp.]